MLFFKRKSAQNYTYYKKYSYYRRRLDQYRRLEDYAVLFAECNSKQRVLTGKEIRLSPTLPFGCLWREVKADMRVASFHEMKDPKAHCSRVFCEKVIGGYKTNMMLHFFKDRLFLFSYDFSTVPDGDSEKIVGILKDKYFCQDSDLENKMIVDEKNNCVFINSIMGLAIYYMALDSEFFHHVREQVEADDRQRREMEKVRFQELYERL